MSHGGGDSGSIAEPNLTPLLDLVLQLLMFFMVCVNFVAEQVTPDVRLTFSESAQPLEKSDTARLFLNIKFLRNDEATRRWLRKVCRDKEGRIDQGKLDQFMDNQGLLRQEVAVLIAGVDISDYPMTMLRARSWLTKNFRDTETKLRAVDPNAEVKTVVHIRPDGDLEYKFYYEIMNACKVSGYKRLKLHAYIGGGGNK
jgi:biopolymer transport protein ExbD